MGAVSGIVKAGVGAVKSTASGVGKVASKAGSKLTSGVTGMRRQSEMNYERACDRKQEGFVNADISGEANFMSFLSEQLNAIKETLYKRKQNEQVNSILADLKSIQDNSGENYKAFLDKGVKNGSIKLEVAEKEKSSLFNSVKNGIITGAVSVCVAKGVNALMESETGKKTIDEAMDSLSKIDPKDFLNSEMMNTAKEKFTEIAGKASEFVSENVVDKASEFMSENANKITELASETTDDLVRTMQG